MAATGVERAESKWCNEIRLVCGSCSRHGVSCLYDTPKPSLNIPGGLEDESMVLISPDKPSLVEEYGSSSSFLPLEAGNEGELETYASAAGNSLQVFDMAESKARRILELQLLQNFMVSTSHTLPASNDANVRHAWSIEVPDLAIQNDSLLDEVLSISAQHLSKSQPQNSDLVAARQAYFELSLRDHRIAVSQVNPHNADAACFTSLLIIVDVFASLQDRVTDPYSPPVEWLKMARGAGCVFNLALRTLEDVENAKISSIVRAPPAMDDINAVFSESNRKHLLGLLSQDIPAAQDVMESWDAETQGVYEQTLSYIGSVQLAINNGEHAMGICSRLLAFTFLMHKTFIRFIEEQRPRALVILAHYFALAANLEHIWWIGSTARREVRGIQKILPLEWQDQMTWPLANAGLTPVQKPLRLK